VAALPLRQVAGVVGAEAVDDLRKDRLRLELGEFFPAVAALPLVDFIVEFLNLVRRERDPLVVEKIRQHPVEFAVALVGHDIHHRAVDVEQESADHRLNLLKHNFAS